MEPLGYKFRKIEILIKKYFGTKMVSDGKELTRMQSATIRYLSEHSQEEIFQKDYEKAFSISGATATNILKLMEKDGIIQRIPLERDGRLKKLVLTEKGCQLEEEAKQTIRTLEEQIVKGLSEEEKTRFSETLDKITLNIVELLEEGQK